MTINHTHTQLQTHAHTQTLTNIYTYTRAHTKIEQSQKVNRANICKNRIHRELGSLEFKSCFFMNFSCVANIAEKH